jgi:hypothetical protein
MHYPATAYRQLFPGGKHGASTGTGVLDSSEDGDHYEPKPNFFEWWYFDAVFADGACLVAIFHSALYNLADHRPMVELRYYPPARPPVSAVERFDRSMYSAAPDHCEVRIGDCLAVDKGSHYWLSLRQGVLAAELTFWPLLPGWKAGTGHLLADPASEHYFDWVVPVAHACVEGVLDVAGQRRTVTGVGYHDHNWGNVYLPNAFSRWTWGRVLTDDWTLIFGDVVGRGVVPAHVTPFLLAHGDTMLLSTDRVCIEEEQPAKKLLVGADHHRRLHLTTEREPAVRLTLTTREAIEAVDFAAPHRFLACDHRLRRVAEYAFYAAQNHALSKWVASWLMGKGSYLRWKADYQLALPECAVVKRGQTLFEMMRL